MVKYHLYSHPRAPGKSIMEFVCGGVVSEATGACWLDNGDDALSFGTIVAQFHSQPSCWYRQYAQRVQDHVINPHGVFPLFHPYSFLNYYLGDSSVLHEELERAISVSDVPRFGESCLEIVGFAMGLRRSLREFGGRWRGERLPQTEVDKWCKLLDFIVTFTPKAYNLLSGGSLMGRLVIGHGDLQSKNLLRRTDGSRGHMVLIDYDRVHSMPAAVDIGSSVLLSLNDPDDNYPSLANRQVFAAAYLNCVREDSDRFSHRCIDDIVFDLEKGAVLRALAVPLFLIHRNGLQKTRADAWSFVGLASRGVAAIKAAMADPFLKDTILQRGVKAELLRTDVPNPFLDYRFFESPEAFQAWFPFVDV